MISIRDTISELERSEQVRALVQECYLAAVKNLAQYAIELEASSTLAYRDHLTALATEVESGEQSALSESRATLRGLLRDYRDKASSYLNQMREELSRTATGLQRLVETLSQTDGDHESRLRQALQTLHQLAKDPAAAPIAPALRDAGNSIEQSLDLFRQQQQLTVSQFLAEIHLLHKRIDALESAVSADDLTKIYNREQMETRIRAAQTGGSLLLLSVQGFDRAAAQFSPDVAQQLAAAFVKRLRKNLVPQALLGSWSADEFIVVHPTPKSEALAAAKWITEHLSGAYACLQGGRTVRPMIQVNVAVLEFVPGPELEHTLQKISQFFK